MDSMRVFDQFSKQRQARANTSKGKKSTPSKKASKERPQRMALSASDIRAKVEENSKPKEVVKAKPVGQKFGDGFLSEDVKVDRAAMKANAIARQQEKELESKSEDKDYTLPSDVAKNEPDNPMTTEKLKSVLGTGAFSFNPKEREVLSRILGDG